MYSSGGSLLVYIFCECERGKILQVSCIFATCICVSSSILYLCELKYTLVGSSSCQFLEVRLEFILPEQYLLKRMAKTIATIDLKSSHENYLEIKNNSPKNGETILYFLAACQYFDPDIDFEAILKMRTYGGLIGIDNSSLDNYFKSFKILRLHAILHDASGFIAKYGRKGPGYSYVLPCPITNEYLGHITGLAFCSFVKTFKNKLFTCWNAETKNSDIRFLRFSLQENWFYN